MGTLTDKTKVTLGFALTLAVFLAGAWITKARVEQNEIDVQKLETRVKAAEDRINDGTLQQKLLEQKLDTMATTLREIREDVRTLTSSGVRSARGRE